MRWYHCGIHLLEASGKTGPGHMDLPSLYKKHSVIKDPEFLEYLMAIIYVESRFNRDALSHADAYGLMQITEVAMIDASRSCNMKQLFNMKELHDSSTNIRYGSCFLKKLLQETEGDLDRALILYNGGYRQLTKYDKGEPIVTETANYVIQVRRALGICRSPKDGTLTGELAH